MEGMISEVCESVGFEKVFEFPVLVWSWLTHDNKMKNICIFIKICFFHSFSKFFVVKAYRYGSSSAILTLINSQNQRQPL